MTTPIKHLLFTSFLLLFGNYIMAQSPFNYEAAWKKVDEFFNQGKPKSAEAEIDKIYEQAKKEGKHAQQIKSVIYKSQAIQQVEEDSWLKNIKNFEKEIATAAEPIKQILYSVSADLYRQYFQQQRWKIYDRGNTTTIKDDPETWSITDFNEKISKYYQHSLTNPSLLQKTKLDGYDPIVLKGNTRQLRPTLYDLLGHQALNFWKNDESEITKPVYAFELNDQAALAPAKIFVRHIYRSKDSASNRLIAIRLYQDLIRFHLQDASPDALIDVDIQRLAYAHSQGSMQGKNQLYKEALEHIYTQYPNSPFAMQAGYLLSDWWRKKGDAYSPATGTEEDKNAYKIAITYADAVLKKFPESEGGINAGNLVGELRKPELGLTAEKVNIINKPFRVMVNFKNSKVVHFRLVKADRNFDEQNTYNRDDEAYWARLIALPTVRSWTQQLPDANDHRNHTAEVKADGLPFGRYMLIASGSADFGLQKNPLAGAHVYVSNISYVNSGDQYFVLDRHSGQPIAGAKVQVWTEYYDYNSRKNISTKRELLTTDKNGYVIIKTKSENNRQQQIKLEISTMTDYLFMQESIYSYNRFYQEIGSAYRSNANKFENDNARYYFFTDRSIYRPGQILHFKAIGITRDAGTLKSKLFKPGPVEVILRNANYEKVSTATFTPGEYGSIYGKFTLPTSGLTGNFQLEVKMGDNTQQTSFRVEEYKRPKFFVEYTPVKGSYRLNDNITVTGLAKGYAGNNIDGAMVKYRVYRQTRYLYPWLFWGRGGRGIWPPQGSGEQMEITNGEVLTKADGSFDIVFTALPDLSVDKKLDPTFDYRIEAEVTDINGETRSGETSVSVGYKSLFLNLGINGDMVQQKDSLHSINISTQNLNGEAQPSTVQLSIYELQAPDRLIRNRYWNEPDTFVMSKAEFIKHFPNDAYANEDDYRNWTRGKRMVNETINTASQSAYKIRKGELGPGYYLVEGITKDKYGQEVKALTYVGLYDAQTGKLPAMMYQLEQTVTGTAEPGQKALFMQGTSATNLFIVQETLKKSEIGDASSNDGVSAKLEFLQLDKMINQYSFNAVEADRGGYAVNRFFVHHNRVYTSSWRVNVPWTNKELKISYETFRDKLTPGQEETWKVKISGHKGDKVAAELLASMYDASLDQFAPHNWGSIDIWKNNYLSNDWNGRTNYGQAESRNKNIYEPNKWFDKQYDRLMTVGNNQITNIRLRGMASGIEKVGNAEMAMMAAPAPQDGGAMLDEAVTVGYGTKAKEEREAESTEKADPPTGVQIRSNFNETAFFFPDLQTDEQGNVSFSFTIPEALTQWKLQLMAHTTDMRFARSTRTAVTQKQLMVLPNPPRFLRQGDNMELSVKISNITESELTGQCVLQLINPATMQPVDGWFKNVFPNQYFSVEGGKSIALKFPIEIPYQYNEALMYRVIAKAGDIGDGEEMALPVLTNRMLVTESFPINMRGTNSQSFTWDKLLKSGTNESMQHHNITVEYTTNPAWYAVQALPYLMEYPYDCSEQTWNRFYANALSSKIANSSPRIKEVFESWKNITPEALLSNLQKNEELKNILLEETPWVLQAKNETEQKRNIGLLFDLVRMSNEAASAMNKLTELQSPNGGFVWFKGGRDDRYMTQYILTGIGHLRKLDAWPANEKSKIQTIVSRAIPYLDARIKEDYDRLVQSKAYLNINHLSSFVAQYLYMRSFFTEMDIQPNAVKAVNFYKEQAVKYWTKLGKYEQGMIALAMHRNKNGETAKKILASLTEFSITNPEFGMYWKEFNSPGWYWWQAPIESHALLMEAYHEIENNEQRTDDLKTWLLKQKQTTNWKTTKATAEACYALLLRGTDWLSEERTVTMQLGDYTVSSAGATKAEAGTGYFKTTISAEKIKPEMGNIKVSVATDKGNNTGANKQAVSTGTSWGAVYWQYFEDLDKITTAATPVSIDKKLYVVRNTDRGPVMDQLDENKALKVGDKVKVRVEIRTDRNLEYVHLKDMRASCFEPLNVLSSYKYQGGLGYYESTRDAGTHFFISYMGRGTYVFEYELRVTHSGNFSNGITTLQCMYAPEFSSHSEGIRVNVAP